MDKLIYINGEWSGADLERINVLNPATGETVGTVPKAGERETRLAIDAAYQAFVSWSSLTAYDRADYLETFCALMLEHDNEIARMLTLEMGKPLKEALGDVQYAASFIRWFAEEGKRIYGREIPTHRDGTIMQVIKQPLGVVGAITPWNFPVAMITRKMGPALASGCTFIVKPSSKTPLTAILLVELAEKAGIPKGVVNLVTGSASEISKELMYNRKVRKITFTGSTEIGKELIRHSADQIKSLSLELGGHAPMIILDDADLDKAVKGVIGSKFRNGGQTCICVNRIYVHEDIYEEFIDKFAEATQQLVVGNGMDDSTDIGPIIDKEGYEKIDHHVKDALNLGAKCLLGGKGNVMGASYFYEPTILRDVTPEMVIMNEETFGPVAPVQKISSAEEAIRYANETPLGLAAYVFTENYIRGMKVIRLLDYGIIGWNDGLPSAAQAPFGGMKQSGIGREGGIEGIEAFLETKFVSIGLA